MDTPGSTKLTLEQREWYEDHFGILYTHVEDNPVMPSRRWRRRYGRLGPSINQRTHLGNLVREAMPYSSEADKIRAVEKLNRTLDEAVKKRRRALAERVGFRKAA